jgi:hypothetical protein
MSGEEHKLFACDLSLKTGPIPGYVGDDRALQFLFELAEYPTAVLHAHVVVSRLDRLGPLPHGEGIMANGSHDTGVLPSAGKATITLQPQYVVIRYEPEASRILGAGTSSVVPARARGLVLPEGAVLVSDLEERTATSGGYGG